MHSSEVRSNQTDVHPDLGLHLEKYGRSPYRRQASEDSLSVFQQLHKIVSEHSRPLIFDSGCGTGESSIKLACSYPGHLIIGTDKSGHRLARHLDGGALMQRDNLILARINSLDLWQLAAQHEWRLSRHYLFYPNPWPKKKHLQRRWHGHPIFPTLLRLGGYLQLRTNWEIFHHEFTRALQIMGQTEIVENQLECDEPISAFEKKYRDSGHTLYQTEVELR